MQVKEVSKKKYFEMTYYLVIKCNFSTQATCRINVMHTCGKLINSRHQICQLVMCEPQVFGLREGSGSAKFASEGRSGGYLCTYRNLNF